MNPKFQRRSAISKTVIIGDTPIPPELGTTITGAIANLYTGTTVVIYSAANDTVTFTDAKGTHSITTDLTGRSDPVKIATSTTSPITFISSIAKNPNNLSANYTKSVTVTGSTTAIYVMPENTLYWWGYNGGVEAESNANGWTVASTYPFTAPTFDTNSVRVASATSASCGFGSSKQLQINKGYCIASNVSGRCTLRIGQYKSNVTGYNEEEIASGLNVVTNTSYGVTLAVFMYGPGKSCDISAIWYE